jgi:aspartyl-tRNA(Asn)/glutamyl-tRNA(Gln) amidotransferase subunit A
MDDVCFLDVAELARLIANRDLSSTELTRAYLERIERFDPLLRAFITVDADRALAAAQVADATFPSGALHGVPIAVKDNIATRGLRTTAGSRVLANWVPDQDAPVVRSLADAGAVLIGKTNLHEFAYGGTCTNVEFGAVRNPWNTAHVPGGSSGGSGVAVAAGLCAAALGTDTAGSVRLPAAQCGVVGLKPTYSRTSIERVIPLAWSLDHVGPITRCVADAALLLDVLAGTNTFATHSSDDIAGVRIGVPRKYFFDDLQSDVAVAIGDALNVLGGLGATLVDVEWPAAHLSNSATWTIIMAESSAYHRPWFRSRRHDYAPETRANLDLAELLPASDYVQAQRVRTVLRQQVREVLSTVDALATPSLAITAPLIGQTGIEIGGKTKAINPVFIRLADPFNLTGTPAISVPCGFGANGLPVGLQLATAAFQERMVLRVASAFEAATEWHRRHPALVAPACEIRLDSSAP